MKDINTHASVEDLVASDEVKTAIKHYELYKGKVALKAYGDMGGVATIGYGMTVYPNGSKVKLGDSITAAQAEDMFELLLPKYERKVRVRIKIHLLQREYDAAVMFCWNAGTGYKDKRGKYHDFNLWENINNRIPDLDNYWHTLAITGSGIPAPGLIRRRKTEYNLFSTGVVNYYE